MSVEDPVQAVKAVIRYLEASRRHERMMRSRLREALSEALRNVRNSNQDSAKSVIKTALDNDSSMMQETDQAVLEYLRTGYDDVDEIANGTVLEPQVVVRVVRDLAERGIIGVVEEGGE